MSVPEDVEADGLKACSFASRIEHSPPVVRLVESAAIGSREDERLATRMASAKTMSFQRPPEVTRDRDAAGASLALRLLLAVEQPVPAG